MIEHYLRKQHQLNSISDIEYYFSTYNLNLLRSAANYQQEHDLIALICLIVYQYQLQGHTAIQLTELSKQLNTHNAQLSSSVNTHTFLDLQSLSALLKESQWATELRADQLLQLVTTPLALIHIDDSLEHTLVCFQRQLDVQQSISETLSRQIAQKKKSEFPLHTLSKSILATDQQTACLNALDSRFSLICGGPGSGKTSTVFHLLANLLINLQATDTTLNIALAASTGKAAARLTQSIQSQLVALPDLQSHFENHSLSAKTLHRLLEFSPRRQMFLRNETQPLDCDILIIDEISMLSFDLFNATLKALKPECKIICLGDKNQLAAIEGGDIIASVENSILRSQINSLDGQYRFNANSSIASLLNAIKDQQAFSNIAELLQHKNDDSLSFIPIDIEQETVQNSSLLSMLQQYRNEFSKIHNDKLDILEKLQLLNEFQVLSPFHDGILGVNNINTFIETELRRLSPCKDKTAFSGQRIIILQNYYPLDLYNGDTAVILQDPQDLSLKAYFTHTSQDAGQTIKSIPLSQLPSYASAYAMSVHKAQGSEFDKVCLVIPPAISENQASILQRPLIYTGLSRARQHITLLADMPSLQQALEHQQSTNTHLLSFLLGQSKES